MEIEGAREIIQRVRREMHKVLVGQETVVDGLLTGLIADGHVLLEGVPGLAKTVAARTLAAVVSADFTRIQFTPDLLPADLTGTLIYRQQSGEFEVRFGPLFSHIILADEINRAPAKVQSALLEAMEERQVTIGENSYQLKEPFFVAATQNPIELEGTYPLPEAQIDRFLIKLLVDYPSNDEEVRIVEQRGSAPLSSVSPVLPVQQLEEVRNAIESIEFDKRLVRYAVDLVRASRPGNGGSDSVSQYVRFGSSPRGSLALFRCARIGAFFNGRAYVLPEDIKNAALPVLRHRIILSYQAEAEGITADELLRKLLLTVPVP